MRNILDLKNEKRKKFGDYCEELPYPKDLKLKVISFFKNISKGEEIYLIYPALFAGQLNKSDVLDKICFASFFFYNSINLKDSIYDNKGLKKDKINELIFISEILHEEGIKLLTTIVDINSPFWKTWNKRRMEYLYSVKLEKEYNSENIIPIERYESLADNRSAFGKIAIDICYYLFPEIINTSKQEILIESHRYFSIGLQILDDIADVRKDLINNQVNIAISETLKFELERKGENYSNQLDPEYLLNVFYKESIAINTYREALKYLKRSKDILRSTSKEFDLWTQVIEIKEKEAELNIANIEYQFKKWDTFSKVSHTFKKTNSPDIALKDSLNYIISNQCDNGSWLDYSNNAGMSDIWTTGYILNQLSFENKNEEHITKACEFLFNNKQEKLWGYNQNWIKDTDSSTCALFALSNNGYKILKEYEQWKKKQLPSGGFSTYTDDDDLFKSLNYSVDDFRGWTNEHFCVSALAYSFLCSYNIECKATEKLENFLFKKANTDSSLSAYWWTSPVYTISIILETIIKFNRKDDDVILSMSSKLIDFINNDEGLVVDMTGENNYFFTAMAISTLCSKKIVYDNYKIIIDSSINNLLKYQYEDGSFPASNSLKIPSPDIVDPEEVKKWNHNHRGTNIITKDFMRLFTTASCYKAILKYRSI